MVARLGVAHTAAGTQAVARTAAALLVEVPPVEVLITEDAPSPLNPPGVKGAGEAGINAVGAAIASAIDDALGQQIVVTRLPVTPTQIKRALQCNPGM